MDSSNLENNSKKDSKQSTGSSLQISNKKSPAQTEKNQNSQVFTLQQTTTSVSPITSYSQSEIDHRPWNSNDIGHNSISAVLNDPTYTQKSSLVPMLKLDSITSLASMSAIPKASIQPVRLKDFHSYITDVEPIVERYNDVKNSVQDGDSILFEEDNFHGTRSDSPMDRAKRDERMDKIKSMAQRTALKADPISSIPAIFFNENFNLQDPRTFDAVTEFSNVTSANASILSESAKDKTNNSVLQEKLSHYLDTVEVHLVAEISLRSLEFFSALSNIRSLQETTVNCIAQLRAVRNTLQIISEEQSKKGIEVICKHKLKSTVHRIYDYICYIDNVRRTQTTIQILLNHGDYIGALDVINDTMYMLKVTPSQSDQNKPMKVVPYLNAVKGLTHLNGQLFEMVNVIGNLMQNDFMNILIQDVEKNSAQYLTWSTQILDGKEKPNDLQLDLSLQQRIQPLIQGLLKVDLFSQALQMFRDKVMKFIKSITKQYFPPALPDEKGVSSDDGKTIDNALSKRFKLLSFNDFQKLLFNLFVALLQYLRQLQSSLNSISMVLKNSQSENIVIGSSQYVKDMNQVKLNSPDSKLDAQKSKYSQYIAETADVLFAASDLAHVRCGKFMTLRSEQNSQLNLKDFSKLSDLCWNFVNTGESMCGRTCIGLRGVLKTQAKAFLLYFHMERAKQLTFLLDEEKWVQAEIPIDFQIMVDKLLNKPVTSMSDRRASLKQVIEKDKINSLQPKEESMDNQSMSSHLNMNTAIEANGKNYHVVASTLLLIKMYEEFITCLQKQNSLAPDILNKMIDLAKLFNSKTNAIIAGGAAVQSSVLKSISAKHLILAINSLGLLSVILRNLRFIFDPFFQQQQSSQYAELDQTINEIVLNQNQISSRIVMIMEDRVLSHIVHIYQINWDAEDQSESQNVKPHIIALVKETQKLHSILRKYSHPDQLNSIFVEICKIYNKRIEQELQKLDIYSSIAKSKLLADVQYLITQLSLLEGIEPMNNQLEVVVNNMKIKDKKDKPVDPPSPPKPLPSQAKNLPSIPNLGSLTSQSKKEQSQLSTDSLASTASKRFSQFSQSFANFGRQSGGSGKQI